MQRLQPIRKKRRILTDIETRTGLLADSILAADLYFPSTDNPRGLEYKSANAGRYIAYDFNRPEVFDSIKKDPKKQVREGRLGGFMLNSIEPHDPSELTPIGTFNLFDVDHFLQLDFPPASELVERGYLKETTIIEAFKNVQSSKEHLNALYLLGGQDKNVLQVTPKGNGLLFLARDIGPKARDPKKVPQLKPAFNF